jgi:hypothetical protein
MIERDVLMRQIQQLAQALANIVQLVSNSEYDAAIKAVDEACSAHLDGSAEGLRTLPPSQVLALCTDGERFLPDAAQTLAKLLTLQGDAHRERGEQEKAGACYSRALLLMRRVLQEPDAPVSWQIGTKIAALKDKVDDHPVAEDMAVALNDLRD